MDALYYILDFLGSWPMCASGKSEWAKETPRMQCCVSPFQVLSPPFAPSSCVFQSELLLRIRPNDVFHRVKYLFDCRSQTPHPICSLGPAHLRIPYIYPVPSPHCSSRTPNWTSSFLNSARLRVCNKHSCEYHVGCERKSV